MDEDESGIADVEVKIGEKTAITNANGYYETKIRSKKVDVGINIDTIPEGYIFSTNILREVDIVPHKRQMVDFGLTTHSGIYGSIFYDKNENGKPDVKDVFISKVEITLDDKDVKYTDHEGTFSFRNIKPGKHKLRIDINSLPVEYLPKIKLENEIEVFEGTMYMFHIPCKKK